MAKQRMGDGNPGRTSGEYSDLLLAAIKEIRDDQKEFRQHVGEKLEVQSAETQSILVTLAEGTGRMNLMQQSIDTLSKNSEELKRSAAETDRRIRNIEVGSGSHRSISARPTDDKEEAVKSGGWISVDKLPALIGAIGSVIAVIVSSIALAKSPAIQNQNSTASNTPATTTPTPTTTPP